ncbi:hypothetical protein, partial [Dietzia sp. E1]|uniref:hypothetical protein n=1 Tax=Dietzia sp. E1 TaxID=328361 RepID=UPI0019D5A6AD
MRRGNLAYLYQLRRGSGPVGPASSDGSAAGVAGPGPEVFAGAGESAVSSPSDALVVVAPVSSRRADAG